MSRTHALAAAAALTFLTTACGTDGAQPLGPGAESPRHAGIPSFGARAAGIAPSQASPHGRTYGEWAAAWWQWALEIPVSSNPVVDPTGEHCAVNQQDHVWFLGGAFGSGSVVRACTIPSGTALFFPIINTAYFAFITDPPETRTEEYLRAQVTCVESAEFGLIEIDGVPVDNPEGYLEQSVLFDVILPEDNVFGLGEDVIPELTLSPSVDQGFYLFLNPLPPGEHTLHWQAEAPACGNSQDITYHLTVTSGRS